MNSNCENPVMSGLYRAAKRIVRLTIGFLSIFHRIYFRLFWHAGDSSILDNRKYRDFCLSAATKPENFKRFRSNWTMFYAMENRDFESGRQYLETVLAQTPHYRKSLDLFRQSDLTGDPLVFDYPDGGLFSPCTLRYLKYLSDCEVRFGSFDSKIIAEIGGGYGGLCKLFFDRFDVKSYVLIDLPEPLALAKRFLTARLGKDIVEAKVEFIDAEKVPELGLRFESRNFDLAVSTIAFSECRKKIQNVYIEYILNKSSAGYLVVNALSGPYGIDSYPARELRNRLKSEITITEDTSWWWDDRVQIWSWMRQGS